MNKQMENLMYLLLHFLTGQTRPERSRRMCQSGIVVHDAPGTCLTTVGASTPAGAADTARRLLAAWNACEGIPTAALEAGAVKNVISALRLLNDEFPPQAQVSFSLAKALGDADRALLPLNAAEAQPLPAAFSVERVETAVGFVPDDENSAPDFADDDEEGYDAAICAKNGEEYHADICAECGHSVEFGSGCFVNRVPIFDSYGTRCEMGYSYPEGAYICPECEQAITEKCADY
jgi:hypothetical protein